jgi:hypothetical protein
LLGESSHHCAAPQIHIIQKICDVMSFCSMYKGIGGRNINNLRYADDTTILAERKRDLEKNAKKVKGRK